LGASGRGSYNDIVQGMLFAAGVTNHSGTMPARRADVINLSLGGQGACPSAVRDVIAQVRAAGTIVVAAAGNDGGKPVSTPANCPGAIAVSAIAYVGEIATYSNFGPEVVVTAPGGDLARTAVTGPDAIWSTHAAFPTNSTVRSPNYAGMNGTSMATPHVAGVMALMRAVNPDITPAQIDALFADGSLTHDVGAAGRDNLFGYGMINALKAVTAAGAAPPPPSALPTLALSTNRLDFGSVLTQLTITLTRINNSTDSFARAVDSALNPDAVTITPDANDPAAGPYTLLVAVDRALLTQGEDIIQVEITSAQNRTLRFDVVVAPRTQGPVGLQGVGPVYVLALDPETFVARAQANVVANSAAYAYTLSDLRQGVLIVAGTDTDNDGFICGAIEPCGAFPVRGAEMTVVSSSRSDVSFTLVQGGASAIAAGDGPAAPALPVRGFGRIR
ncbi:MAG TPA: S8 family serine peptidase, partial [Burkholderiaceae bacterium]|nr:S8 family serine peptidase [Burkholderiaceae bacterium]